MVLLLAGCNFQQLGPQDFARQTEVRATELELHVQQTLIGQQSTAQSQRITQAALTTPTTAIPTLQPSRAPAVTAGADLQPTLAPSEAPLESPGAEPALTETAPAPDETALDDRIKAANILLYEDMVARNNTNRYVKDTLVRMGLPFKDDGNAGGWLVDDLKKGAPNGKPWDLVIIALEDKVSPQSGFFSYALQAEDAGASVILETWFLNSTYSGGAQSFLDRCGVAYMGDRKKIAPSNLQLYPMGSGHTLLEQPNSGFSLTKTTNYWWDASGKIAYDTGDLLKLTSDSRAELVIGAQPQNPGDHATVAVCSGGRIILQTFSSHTLTYDTMTLLWENYIYNALKARFEAAQ